MMMTKAPPPAKSKAPPPPGGSSQAEPAPTRTLKVASGVQSRAQKTVIYGPGGVGKTELASLLAQVGVRPLVIDLEDGSGFLDVTRVDPTPETFEETLAAVEMAKTGDFGAVVIDSLTKGEELCVDYTLRTVKAKNKPDDPGRLVASVEGYGWGKGYTHVFEQFLKLLQALDSVARAGKHVVAICHDCTANVPNPGGDDWIRYEPRLLNNNKGMIRQRVKEWCDHLLYIDFEAYVEDGKAQGSGTRTIYPTERPTHWAKSRKLSETIPYVQGDATLWRQLFDKE